MKQLLSIFTFLITSLASAQSLDDNLEEYTYEELNKKAMNYVVKDEFDLAKKHADIYIHKAKKAHDSLKISHGFFLKSWSYDFKDKRAIIALDSSISYIQNHEMKDKDGMVKRYNKKALHYGAMDDLSNSLDNLLIGLEYAKKNENYAFENMIKHNIAQAKITAGKYEEAKILLNGCLSWSETEMINKKTKWDTINYMQTLVNTVTVYRLNKQLDSAKILNNKGIEISKTAKGYYNYTPILALNEAIFDYHNKNYLEAKKKIIRNIPNLTKDQNKAVGPSNYMQTYLYLGLSYKHLDMPEEAIENFKKADSINTIDTIFGPETIEIHKELVAYYKSIGDQSNELIYINKLIKSDSIANSNYKVIGDRLIKEFDTKELIEEKQRIITSLQNENSIISKRSIIISILFLVSTSIAGFYFYRQRIYKKRFLKLVTDQSENINNKRENKDNTSAINDEIRHHLLQSLQQFEDDKKYLDTDIGLGDLAKSFDSNSTYLSKVINKHKGKNFTQYINDLRVDYVIDKLKNDSLFRKYTVFALAQEIGFNTSEAFSRAFYKKTGIYPSYFVKELLKQ